MQQLPDHWYQPGAAIAAPIRVYLLHAVYPDGTIAHYVGSTKMEEFPRRMRAHASGYGTTRTGLIFDAKADFWLVRVWDRPDRSWETALHRQQDHAPWCSLCSPMLAAFLSDVPPPFRLDGAPPRTIASLSFGYLGRRR